MYGNLSILHVWKFEYITCMEIYLSHGTFGTDVFRVCVVAFNYLRPHIIKLFCSKKAKKDNLTLYFHNYSLQCQCPKQLDGKIVNITKGKLLYFSRHI